MKSLKDILIQQEGLRLKPYKDTIGKLTIGVGRNLDDVGISENEAMMLLEIDINKVVSQANSLPWFIDLSANRQNAILSMIFNVGLGGLLKFENMIEAIKNQDFKKASEEMLNSHWAAQVGDRAKFLADLMLNG